MPVTDKQLPHIAWLAKERRDTLIGASKWDIPGIEAALRQVAHLELSEVTCAAMRAAADRAIATPAPIGITTSSCWRERLLDRGTQFEVVTRENRCRTCGRHRNQCIANPFGDHTFTPDFEVEPDPAYTDHAKAARELLHQTSAGGRAPDVPGPVGSERVAATVSPAEHVHRFTPTPDGELHGKTRYRNRCTEPGCDATPHPTPPPRTREAHTEEALNG